MSATTTGVSEFWATRTLGIELRHDHSYRHGATPDALPAEPTVVELVRPGLRKNPRRAHLLVSTVLGKHLPTDPRVVLDAGNRLGDLVRGVLGARPAVVLGFAETATGLGHCVAARIEASCYLHSTRRRVPEVETLAGFEEGHSHATSHLLQPVPADIFSGAWPLVLVDDEISTGDTALDAIRALHSFGPRAHYVLASLVDMRTEADRERFAAAAAELGARIDTVCLASGRTYLPGDLPRTVQELPEVELNPIGARKGSYRRVELPWPAGVPEGGRHGFLRSDTDGFDRAVDVAARVLRDRLAADHPGRPVIVLGHEELMYLPLRLAVSLAEHDVPTRYQTTTRSPAYVLDEPGYPLRRGFRFVAAEYGEEQPRYLYNARWAPVPGRAHHHGGPGESHHGLRSVGHDVRLPWAASPGEGVVPIAANGIGTAVAGDAAAADGAPGAEPVMVVVVDAPADTPRLVADGGLVDVLTAAGADVLVAVLPGADPRRLVAARTIASAGPASTDTSDMGRAGAADLPSPLYGPEFGSYASEDVAWLLQDLSEVDLEADTVYREKRIQDGLAHYAESLPIEYQPDAAYRALFDQVLAESAQRLALAVATVSELVVAERGSEIVLVSLARAGTPVGILMRRWLATGYGASGALDIPHYAVSIVRDRGIDAVALDYLARHHDPASVVFVDGWTGKGAIAKELSEALDSYHAAGGARFDDDLAVLADPGHCVRTYGTRDDFLIASACLNSTVSGLVSRTVLNRDLIGPRDFHGAKFYRHLASDDVSRRLIETVSAAFGEIRDRVADQVAAIRSGDRTPTWAGWASVEQVRVEYGIQSVNFVKPGVGETTRVLLRRVPWRVLVREPDAPEHAHIRLLAQARGVPVEVVPDLAYSCMGLIKDMR
ncbi:phosphoribosyltransferase [Nocardia brevicatena]|uniref:phosphoribosyltransferase n=1 Tax=Nocardia brevicatena TaxID=37327 RepID=UPI000A019155|nr:phosphoribosyltransferase [Nocardia brevicatena]